MLPNEVLHGAAAHSEPFRNLFQCVKFHRHMIPMEMKCSLETLPHDRGTPGWRGFFLFFVGLLNVMIWPGVTCGGRAWCGERAPCW